MTSVKLSDSKRMDLICEFIKTGKQPEGYNIVEGKNGSYRISQVKNEREQLEAKRVKLQKQIEAINARLIELDKPNDSN